MQSLTHIDAATSPYLYSHFPLSIQLLPPVHKARSSYPYTPYTYTYIHIHTLIHTATSPHPYSHSPLSIHPLPLIHAATSLYP